MFPIETLRLPTHPLDNPWPDIARRAHEWGQRAGVVWRDAVVLVPFAQHLPVARRAWAGQGGWLPRIETTQTLARSLGPGEAPQESQESQITFSTAVDRLTVRRLLRDQIWAASWARHDPAAFEQGAQAVLRTAHALARVAASLPPSERDAYWTRGRALLGAVTGPGATERALLRLAFEWAAAAAAPATDALFACRPSAWIVVQAGGPDPLARQLLGAAPDETPRLVIDTDADPLQPFDDAEAGQVTLATCADFEDEAQAAAAQVLALLDQGLAPVALLSHDRLLTRRVRALLARQEVPLQDETGWKLSTTRAAGAVVSILRAARPGASSDDWLDWLKNCAAGWPGLADAERATLALEHEMRRHRWTRPALIRSGDLQPAAFAIWSEARALLDAFARERTRTLADWLQALRDALAGCGEWRRLQADDAGCQVLAAVHLGPDAAGHGPALGAAGGERMTADAFGDWVDAVLEDGSFLPAAAADAPVIVTPLERAMLRPFAALVLPGADAKRLGGAPVPLPLLGDTLAAALLVPTTAQRRDTEMLAFAQTLRAPRLVLLRRRDDAGEALAPSPLFERLERALQRRGQGIGPAPEQRPLADSIAAPVTRPLPVAAELLPDRLSPSACDRLRTCPYSFFAQQLLTLREAEELDDEFEKREYGIWMHAVLHRFHAERTGPLPAEAEIARLQRIADEMQEALGFDPAAFLPFAASFVRFAPRYVEWLHARDAAGARWVGGELEMSARPPAWQGLELHGRIDRIDEAPGADGVVRPVLIDYKTGNLKKHQELVAHPLEDTQLALYAALAVADGMPSSELSAGYLPLDESGAFKLIVHDEVGASAQRVVAEIGDELARIRAGAALPALGEGRVCDYCAVRGLCRRDHWTTPEPGA